MSTCGKFRHADIEQCMLERPSRRIVMLGVKEFEIQKEDMGNAPCTKCAYPSLVGSKIKPFLQMGNSAV